MIEPFDGYMPRIDESAFVHPLALVRGDVQIGELSVIHAGAVINADLSTVVIGRRSMIEDNCVIHAGLYEDWRRGMRTGMIIGDDVILGHGAVVHGRSIGNRVMIGMNATLLHNTEIGDSCVIAAGAVVAEGQNVPPGSFVAGVPGKVKGSVSEKQAIWTGEGLETAEIEEYLTDYIRKMRDAAKLMRP